MDPLTHSLLGASCAIALAPRGHVRTAALIGATAGLLPDVDIFIRSQENPLLFIQYHRHFTHSLILQPVGAAMACLIGWLLFNWRNGWSLQEVFKLFYLPALAAAISHPICDAWTSYGTYIFWPFSSTRVAWNLTSVIDPLFTLTLLAGVSIACLRGTRGSAFVCLIAAAGYLSVAALQQSRAMQAYQEQIASRGHTAKRVVVRPSFGNILLWRGTYDTGDTFYIDAIRAGRGSPTIIEGTHVAKLRPRDALPHLDPNTTQYQDLLIFNHFSDGWIAWHPERENVVGDIRYATLPDSLAPLWGIGLKPDTPDSHVEWLTFRTMNPEKRQAFMRLLWP